MNLHPALSVFSKLKPAGIFSGRRRVEIGGAANRAQRGRRTFAIGSLLLALLAGVGAAAAPDAAAVPIDPADFPYSIRVPLTTDDADRLARLVIAHKHMIRARPIDLSHTILIDWETVAREAEGFLSPEQLAVLRRYASRKK